MAETRTCKLLLSVCSTKFANDTWMEQLGYKERENKPSWWDLPLSTLNLSKSPPVANPLTTCSQAVKKMDTEKIGQLAITDSEG